MIIIPPAAGIIPWGAIAQSDAMKLGLSIAISPIFLDDTPVASAPAAYPIEICGRIVEEPS
jgi:hypothetical protein